MFSRQGEVTAVGKVVATKTLSAASTATQNAGRCALRTVLMTNVTDRRFGYQGDCFKGRLVKTWQWDKPWLVGMLAYTIADQFQGKAFSRGWRG